MKLSLLTISLTLCVATVLVCSHTVHAEDDPLAESRALFAQWKMVHERSYASHAEEHMRLRIFHANRALVAELNADHTTGATNGIWGPFMDMSPREFSETVLMRKHRAGHPDNAFRIIGDDAADATDAALAGDLPEHFDWTSHSPSPVSPISNQGSAGSCWAFSTKEAIEGAWAMKHQQNALSLSAEAVVECSHANCGVFGGYPSRAYVDVIAMGGLPLEKDYPYCSGGGTKDVPACYPCMSNNTGVNGLPRIQCGPGPDYCKRQCPLGTNSTSWSVAAKISSWSAISTNETTIQSELMQRGPLSTLLDAEMLQFYHHGVFEPHSCNSKDLDHAVLIVGWGVDKTIFGDEKPYWIIKNSWGTKWGLDGFFWIRRNKGMCGINTTVTAANV